MSGKRLDWSCTSHHDRCVLTLTPSSICFVACTAREIPPALSQMFGAERGSFFCQRRPLPRCVRPISARAGASGRRHADNSTYAGMMMSVLPADRAVWVWGWENRWRSQIAATTAEYAVTMNAEGIQIADTALWRC